MRGLLRLWVRPGRASQRFRRTCLACVLAGAEPEGRLRRALWVRRQAVRGPRGPARGRIPSRTWYILTTACGLKHAFTPRVGNTPAFGAFAKPTPARLLGVARTRAPGGSQAVGPAVLQPNSVVAKLGVVETPPPQLAGGVLGPPCGEPLRAVPCRLRGRPLALFSNVDAKAQELGLCGWLRQKLVDPLCFGTASAARLDGAKVVDGCPFCRQHTFKTAAVRFCWPPLAAPKPPAAAQ